VGVPAAQHDGSLERIVAILDAFAAAHEADGRTAPLGVTDLSRSLGLPKGTISRYLHRLEDAGVLLRHADRRYVLSNRVYAWCQAATPGGDIRRWARPVMERLAADFGETVSLFIRDGIEAVCIDQVDGRFPIRLSAAVGRHLPLHVGASPRLLLAFAPTEQRESFLAQAPFPRLAPRTITTVETLRQAIAEAQKTGYVLSRDESDEGATGIAVPIRDASREVRAALSVAGPSSRFDRARRDAIVTAIREAARTASMALGFQPDARNVC
jgi:DNA-binding IclR family transcriptional regulator